MKYLLDFDRTLFDTQALYADFTRDGIDPSTLTPAIWDTYQASDYLYPDVVPFLEQHHPADLIILTAYGQQYGDEAQAYQQAKVEQAPIVNLVGQFHYVESDKAVIAQRIAATTNARQPLLFVDDLLTHCQAVQAAVPSCRCFLMNRSGRPVAPPAGITAIQSLTELDTLI